VFESTNFYNRGYSLIFEILQWIDAEKSCSVKFGAPLKQIYCSFLSYFEYKIAAVCETNFIMSTQPCGNTGNPVVQKQLRCLHPIMKTCEHHSSANIIAKSQEGTWCVSGSVQLLRT
jgi:hypothetical protein